MRVLIILAVVALAAAEKVRYDGYQVLQLIPQNERQLNLLRNLQRIEVELDFWTEPRGVGIPVDIFVPPKIAERPQGWFKDTPFNIKDDNVQAGIDKLFAEIESRDNGNAFDLDNYNDLASIETWMEEQAANCVNTHNHHCSVETIGQSHEGRDIKVFHLKKDGLNVHRQSHWIDATIHAREWLATATILNTMDFMLNQYGRDYDATRLVDSYDWYFLPVMNPDGYVYTWTNDRMWRKNRRPNPGSPCVGADLNRNFDWEWGTDGVSHLPCGGTFCGASAASEPETQVVQAKAAAIADHVSSWVTIHAYGNMWMFPWGTTVGHLGNTCKRATDYDEMMVIADATANAIQATHGTTWARGSSCEVIYETSGGTDDYVKGAHGVQMAFCPELRGSSFNPLPAQIRPSSEEFWNGIVAMVDSIGMA